ncbi:hypothetical protein [Actinoplanes couchii]|uniref:Uncharacterized protein n=1 Tax=Actinoplanes couchii TaxID=403638 RepID=A0ABQ3XIB3_9ACTN|nr:hypothetical protein [Actinoplanes couchii]MDR6324692.1 biotin operon repressor [Actinoplanes couchii]GID58247.1 hypothetical protein Aco03nite_066510 [Actinoplanes couchii]
MANRDPADDYRAAVERLFDLVSEVAAKRSRAEVLDALSEAQVAVSRVYRGQVARSESGAGARPRILAYLRAHLGEWISSEDIAAVSGIGEWARRIRELRLEQGYEIEEGGGRYRLLTLEPNEARRDRWHTVSRIRNREGTSLDRVRELLQALAGQVVTLDEINRVAHGKDGPSLARQLRDREMWPVETSADASDLGGGDHRLASSYESDLLHPTQASFPEELRRQVFSRDGFTCRSCRLSRSPDDRPFYLVVRHLDARPEALPALSVERLSDVGRLATSCNRCPH